MDILHKFLKQDTLNPEDSLFEMDDVHISKSGLSEGRKIYLGDETWVNKNHSKETMWTENKDLYDAGHDTMGPQKLMLMWGPGGMKLPSGEGDRLIKLTILILCQKMDSWME